MLTSPGFPFKVANLSIVIACKGPNHHYRRKNEVENGAIKVGIERMVSLMVILFSTKCFLFVYMYMDRY